MGQATRALRARRWRRQPTVLSVYGALPVVLIDRASGLRRVAAGPIDTVVCRFVELRFVPDNQALILDQADHLFANISAVQKSDKRLRRGVKTFGDGLAVADAAVGNVIGQLVECLRP
jgi:hypothetical protein